MSSDAEWAGEERLLHGWGRTSPSRASVTTVCAEDVPRLLASAGGRGALARGLGRSYGDAAQNAGGRVLSTGALTDIDVLDEDRGLVRVGAGASLGQVIDAVLPLGWLPAVLPGTRHVSVGGAIASDVHGKNSHRDGSFCDHVAEVMLALPSGETVVLRPDGDERFWATAGGMGLTGVVLHADLRLRRVGSPWMAVDTHRTAGLDQTMDRLLEADVRSRYTVAWIDLLAGGAHLGRGIVSAADHAGADEAPRAAQGARGWTPGAFRWPNRRGALTPATVRLFNAAYHRAAPSGPTRRLQGVGPFFHPLDALRDWNRLYGRAGLVQHQMVVPLGSEASLAAMIRRLVADGVPPYLTVLKRLGAGRGGLSFPIDGWTVAMDIPAAAPGLAEALDRLDESVVAAGGRVYLAKDARLAPELLPAMYADLPRWRSVRDAMDPAGAMRSDLGRRLRLVPADRAA